MTTFTVDLGVLPKKNLIRMADRYGANWECHWSKDQIAKSIADKMKEGRRKTP